MYETFFQLKQQPFGAVPSPEFYFPGEASDMARQSLVRCIDRDEGVGVVIGPVGSGKTMLAEVLRTQFEKRFQVVLLPGMRLYSRKSLLQSLLAALGKRYERRDEGEMRLALIDYVSSSEESGEGLLLLVDEAHSLSLRILNEMRLLTNLVRNGSSRVRLVLLGAPSLEEHLTHPKLISLAQRITARCYLDSFNASETRSYIQAQIAAAGGAPSLFTQEALSAVYTATDGVPRLVNQVCDHALVLAFTEGVEQIDARAVEEAWSDLQQLPLPFSASAPSESGDEGSSVIEFASLDDDEEDAFENQELDSGDLDSDLEALGEPLDILEMSAPTETPVADPKASQTQSENVALLETSEPLRMPVVTPAVDPFATFTQLNDEEVVVDPFPSLTESEAVTVSPAAVGPALVVTPGPLDAPIESRAPIEPSTPGSETIPMDDSFPLQSEVAAAPTVKFEAAPQVAPPREEPKPAAAKPVVAPVAGAKQFSSLFSQLRNS